MSESFDFSRFTCMTDTDCTCDLGHCDPEFECPIQTLLSEIKKRDAALSKINDLIENTQKAIEHERKVAKYICSRTGKGGSGAYTSLGMISACREIEKVLKGGIPLSESSKKNKEPSS